MPKVCDRPERRSRAINGPSRKRGEVTYPENDDDYEDQLIEKVSVQPDGTYVITCDGWALWCGKECPVKPKVGQTARMYPPGVGRQIRSLFIDGVKIWYRTESEQKEHNEIQLYGAEAKDWLARWDRGESVWSIEMGGIGPAYEQCIHITCAEIVRWFIQNGCDAAKWVTDERWKADREAMEKALHEVEAVKVLGLSGAQWGAAVNLASRLYRYGPRVIVDDPAVKDRKILVQKHFPGSAAA